MGTPLPGIFSLAIWFGWLPFHHSPFLSNGQKSGRFLKQARWCGISSVVTRSKAFQHFRVTKAVVETDISHRRFSFYPIHG